MLEALYEIQGLLVKDMPLGNTREGKALKLVDQLIDELESENERRVLK